jgi:hypothetical protein
MDKLIGMMLAFVGCILLLISGWTKDAGVFAVGSVVGIPVTYLGFKMLFG